MQNLFRIIIFALCCLISFLLLLLFHATQNNAGRVEIKQVKTEQDSTKILLGKSIIQ